MVNHTIPFRDVGKYLADLVQAEEHLEYRAGQVIFYEGHQPYGVYILRKGRVRLFEKFSNGEEKLVRIVEPGHAFGDEALLEGGLHPFSAKAETDVHVSFFSRSVFDLESQQG